MSPEQALWEETLIRYTNELEIAERFDDQGSIEFAKEMIRWSKLKIMEYESIDPTRKKGA